MAGSHASVKVLSVVGAGRSGTTILASMLGEVEGFTSAGELRWLWERGLRDERPCACGEPPGHCPVWSQVAPRSLVESVGNDDRLALDEVVAAQHEVGARRSYPRVLREVEGAATAWPALRTVRAVSRSACTSLAEATGSRVVVDISKRPVDAAVLAGVPDIDHFVLHLVRDPRAVVHSWRRAKTFTAGGRTRTMGTRGLASTVRRWGGNALSAEALRRRLPPSRWLRMRYEELAGEPRASIGRIVDFLGEAGTPPFVDEHTVLLRPNHIVAGNPSRFTTGEVSVRADDAWRSAMSRTDQRIVELATWPLMLRYGYRLGTGGLPN
jgi:hypothetical protein